MLTHESKGDKLRKRKDRNGPPKILVISPGGKTRRQYTREEYDELPPSLKGRNDAESAGGVAVDRPAKSNVDSDDVEMEESDEDIQQFFEDTGGPAQSVDSDDKVEVVTNVSNGPPPGKKPRNSKPLNSRGRNLSPKEVSWALNLWQNEYVAKKRENKRKWAAEVANHFKMPSFAKKGNGDKRLRGWLEDPEPYHEAAAKHDSDRRGQVCS